MAFLPGATNFWKRIVFNPCARPWYVYAEAFAPAFILAWITVRTLDLEDLFRDKARDLLGPGGRATRRSMRHTRKQRFPGDRAPTKSYARAGLVAALRWSQPLENIGLKILLVGAADRFFYNFTSIVIDAPYCETPGNSGPLQRSRSGGRVGILPGGAAVGLPLLEQNRGNWPTNAFGVGLPPGRYTATFGLTITAPTGGINDVRLRLLIQGALLLTDPEGEGVDLGPSETTDLVIQVDFFVFLGGTGAVAWELVGPAVPIGLASQDGWVGIFRTD